MRRPLFLSALLTASVCYAQYPPGQYPPGQYPPGQYPPGQYPPGQYPNTYPTRLPGGIPVNLPVPDLKLPKKGSKDGGKTAKSSDDLKITLASVSGVMRQMSEKELLLQIASGAVLRFRLLVKTQFHSKEGAPVRDSLLHPGDRLTVEVNTDDEETALRVIVDRSGTPGERAAAEKKVEQSAIRAPTTADLGKAHSVTPVQTDAAGAGQPDIPAESTGPVAAPAPRPGNIAAAPDGQIIANARTEASSFSSGLPDFLAEQVTTRYFTTNENLGWRTIDVLTAEVAYHDGKETYSDFHVDGVAVNTAPERSGSWSTGEFGSTLEDVLSTTTNAQFKRRGEDETGGRSAVVFDFTVQQPNSHWILVAADGSRYNPGYTGSLWIDKETGRVLRIEQRTASIPMDFAYSSAVSVLEYGYFNIENNTYLLPARAENVACMHGSGACSRNALAFRNYRKFTAESVVKFKFASDTR